MGKNYNIKNKSQINNLADIRIKRNLSIKELSEISKISIDTITSYETDRLDFRKANIGHIIALCDALKTTPVKLYKGEFGEKLLKICRKTYLKKIK